MTMWGVVDTILWGLLTFGDTAVDGAESLNQLRKGPAPDPLPESGVCRFIEGRWGKPGRYECPESESVPASKTP